MSERNNVYILGVVVITLSPIMNMSDPTHTPTIILTYRPILLSEDIVNFLVSNELLNFFLISNTSRPLCILKARSHIPTRLNSWVGSLSVHIWDRGLQQ